MGKHIALIGASGNIGTKITNELLSRGHTVTAICRNPEKVQAREGVTALQGDLTDPAAISQSLKGHDAIICASSFIPGQSEKVVEAVRQSGVNRFLMVGGAASLLDENGNKIWDSLDLPPEVMNYIEEGMRALDLLKEVDDFDWTFFSPAVLIGPGERTGKFRLGQDNVVKDESGESKISYDDYAVAMVDELEQNNNIKARFTAAY